MTAACYVAVAYLVVAVRYFSDNAVLYSFAASLPAGILNAVTNAAVRLRIRLSFPPFGLTVLFLY